MQPRALALIFALVLSSHLGPTRANFLDSIVNSASNGINSAANAVSSGVGTATNAVSNGVGTAVNATSNGLNIATNATSNGLNVAFNQTGNFVNTAVSSVKDVYNVSSGTITNFTSSVTTALAPAANNVGSTVSNLGDSLYNVTAGTYKGVVGIANSSPPSSNSSSAPSAASAPAPSTEIDATSATSIINALTSNSSGYIPVANSLLVALGQNKSSGVQGAIRNIVNNQTGNTSYPATAVNNTVALGLSEAVVTALVTAKNYTVTVNFNGTNNAVNTTQVLDVFLAGLQDGLTPCARNVSGSSNATSGSTAYFENISTDCCYLVAQPLTYTASLAQSNGATDDVTSALGRSQLLGQSPSLDLTRCLTNQTASTS